ncbi:DUF982 domain-containing protein [Mesorhizobium sp. M4B.F.Ca.ET.215.01.1.1]|nr:DUF982 domain-containing protein [Mesorhizobium sp. M4B.F.Ca.ET.013.02.1.1]RUW69405.1 DUF982 domain-containing protein [Mesorhizobium sp. M4B.F.Ca.ET.049.02.1.2]RVC58833.1 DUF982 domain-containing protein [Mesorhizobium sp. M4B.F.Ca.ET.088.02.2.1]RVD37134.1 DUF982 domain-containing protein [Mesorhizobium sp. M4B.F.Ca.ET.019.03.1.1]RWA61084.1 MAG: DUF982 domain-containing protein [Mesorhizobium sp.]RWX63396.1 DUF982 domain-containing protein [Mesorhizobium sp. M4B.F.Ca.ET.089.01.1.1]TGQ1333
MEDLPFDPPIAVAVGAGFKRDIASLAEMQNFLKEWPPAEDTRLQKIAIKACEAARAGHVTIEQTRRAFMAFAKAAGIVWTGVDPVTTLRRAKVRTIRAARAPHERHTR